MPRAHTGNTVAIYLVYETWPNRSATGFLSLSNVSNFVERYSKKRSEITERNHRFAGSW